MERINWQGGKHFRSFRANVQTKIAKAESTQILGLCSAPGFFGIARTVVQRGKRNSDVENE